MPNERIQKNARFWRFEVWARPHGKENLATSIWPMIGARFYAHLDSAQMRSDLLENELNKEVENGRLFRLLCKLNTINERPE